MTNTTVGADLCVRPLVRLPVIVALFDKFYLPGYTANMVDSKNKNNDMGVAENAVAWPEDRLGASAPADFASPEIERAWLDECEKRWEQHTRDPASSFAVDKVLSDLRKKYRL